MKKIILLTLLIIITFIFAFVTSSTASMKPEEMHKFMKQTEKILKLKTVIKRIQKGDIPQLHLQIIYLVLQNTPEYYIHNLNGVSGNQVFIHGDGHSEAVYDKNEKLVQDGINDGSYNYFDRRKHPLKHYSFDTHPWIMWGNSKKDTTSKKERIFGYVSDLEAGLRKALLSKNNLKNVQKNNWDRNGQLQALSTFILALEATANNSLFSLFEKDISSITDQDIFGVLKGIETGLNKMY